MKMKESEKIDRYLAFARVLEKLWLMKMIVVPVVNGALGTVSKRYGKETWVIGDQKKNRDEHNRRVPV